jgi:arylsulfatase A-like enzyme
MRRAFLSILFLACFSANATTAATQPNVVLIFIDDLGYADVGYQGCSDVATPNIDSIAHSGIRFPAGYVTAPVCGPSRAGLLTGRYQQEFGFEDNPGPFRQSPDTRIGIPLDVPTIGEIFKQAGYRTAWIGKHHSGKDADNNPSQRGFDTFFGFINGALGYFVEKNDKGDLLRGMEPVDSESDYLTDAFGREAVQFISDNKAAPFLLYLPFNGVHAPMDAPEHLRHKYAHIEDEGRRRLAAMLDSVDSNIGRVIDALKAEGCYENTLIFCISDNGGAEDTSNFSYNAPLRELKGSMYDGGIRIPFCLQWPAMIARASFDYPVSTLDVLPTALAAAGINPNTELPLRGRNLLPYFEANAPEFENRFLYWRFLHGRVIRDHEWKLVKPWGGRDYNPNQPWELYHISEDISESNNLIKQHPEVAKRLLSEWNAWSDSLPAPQWGWQPDLCGSHKVD